MESKSVYVFGRSWVIYQWLSILHLLIHFTRTSKCHRFFQFKNLLHSATTSFLSKTLGTFDNSIINTAEQTKDDIAGVRATTNVNIQVIHEPTDTDNDNSSNIGTTLALKHCYLASNNNTSHKSNTDSTHMYLVNATKTISVNAEKKKKNLTRQSRSDPNTRSTNSLKVSMVLLLLFHMFSCWEKHTRKCQQFDN